MSEVDTVLDDGMTDAERHYFQTQGDVTEALSKEIPEPPAELPVVPDAPPLAPEVAPARPVQAAEEEDAGDEPSAQPGKPPKRVGYKKFQAEVEARQALERKMQEDAVNRARIEERLSLLQQALQEPQQVEQPKVKPDPEQDIFGYARYLEDQLNGVVEKVSTYEQQLAAGQAEMDSERRYVDASVRFAQREPNFVQAYNHLITNRSLELLSAKHPSASYDQLVTEYQRNGLPPDIQQELVQEERSLYRGAFEAGRDPAADIWRLAHVRGYRPAQPANGAAGDREAKAAPATNGAAKPGTPLSDVPRSTAPAPGAQPSATDVVASIQNGQRAALSLSNAGGGSVDTELTPQALAEMSETQFQALYDELMARGDKTKLMQLFGH